MLLPSFILFFADRDPAYLEQVEEDWINSEVAARSSSGSGSGSSSGGGSGGTGNLNAAGKRRTWKLSVTNNNIH